MFSQETVNEKPVLKDDFTLDVVREPVSGEAASKVPAEGVKEKKKPAGKRKKNVGYKLMQGRGQAHVQSTFNNTIVTITDLVGNTIVWASSGKCGFKGPKKSTPFAAGVVVKSLVDQAKAAGVREVDCFVRGVGSGREAAVRALAANGIIVSSIKDLTAIPHNGCRPRKPRRI